MSLKPGRIAKSPVVLGKSENLLNFATVTF